MPCVRQKNQPLLSAFSPAPVTINWTAYSGAVCGRSAARQICAQYIPYTGDPAIRTFLTGVFKHTENGLRKRSGYAGRLRGYTLSQPVCYLIDRVTGVSSVKAAAHTDPLPIRADTAANRN